MSRDLPPLSFPGLERLATYVASQGESFDAPDSVDSMEESPRFDESCSPTQPVFYGSDGDLADYTDDPRLCDSIADLCCSAPE